MKIPKCGSSSDANPSDSVKQIPQRPQRDQRRPRVSIYGPASDALDQIHHQHKMSSSDANPPPPPRPQLRRSRMSLSAGASDALDQKKPEHSEGDKSQSSPTHIPEMKSSCCNRMLFWWVTPLLVLSGKRSLASSDLWTTPADNRAGSVTAEVERLYADCKVILNGCP